MTDIDTLRLGVRTLFDSIFEKEGAELHSGLSAELEAACFEAASEGSEFHRAAYSQTAKDLRIALSKDYGDFLEAPLAIHIAEGRISVKEVVNPRIYNAHQKVDHRKVYRGVFYKLLMSDERFADEIARDFATRLEKGCWNATIAHCANSADSYRRRWDSPMFVNIYSGRCGLVSSNIDPRGSVSTSVGSSWALDRLASGAWEPESLGAMSATELCPAAGKAERDEIVRRLDQKVDEKSSSLFACPRCHKRNHTYRQVQIGAGDEPSTFMCTCKECGTHYEGYA